MPYNSVTIRARVISATNTGHIKKENNALALNCSKPIRACIKSARNISHIIKSFNVTLTMADDEISSLNSKLVEHNKHGPTSAWSLS